MKTTSIKLEDDMLIELKRIAKFYGVTISEFIRTAVKKELAIKQQDFMYRLSTVPYATEQEEQAIMDDLNALSDDDLTIVQMDTLKL